MTTDKIRKDKNQNIQVFIRLRPLNQRERDIKSLGVIEVVNNREVVVRQSQQTSLTKKFTFDRAFDPSVTQLQVYQEVVSPLIEEVLNGYNCTVFAYGQTGTGKTHTMVGEHTGTDTHWQNDPLAGIIPRALSQLFDELRLSNTEYTVRVSYLELYNEELFDLLSTSEDNSKLRIYEDVTRKGSNIVNGLEEITVYNKNEVYKIMSQGQERKRVASTLMNAQSSRSHTVFTIVVHMRENCPEGEELVKIGKLNLVDLAGSENISKAGSDNPAKKERARECVNINQSLLTLGRVITALVERHPHIPYRESKLTRILQESLGGRTKTSIIATISPGHKDLEETMSTLEYAHRAKNIQNKPEVNQKMTKKAILKEYAEEIDRLKRDLQASRDKTGVYLASETFAEMTIKDEEQRKEIQELLLKKKAMEDERDRMEAVFSELNDTLETKNKELAKTETKLMKTKETLASTSHQLNKTIVQCEEKQHLVEVHSSTEHTLTEQAQQLLETADVATQHVHSLHDTVDKRRNLESTNLEITKTYREECDEQRQMISTKMLQFTNNINSAINVLKTAIEKFTNTSTNTQEENKQQLDNLSQIFIQFINQIQKLMSERYTCIKDATTSVQNVLHTSVQDHHILVENTLNNMMRVFSETLQQAHDVDLKHNVDQFVQQWYLSASERVASVRRAHFEHCARSARRSNKSQDVMNRQRDGLKQHTNNEAQRILTCNKEMQQELSQLKERLEEQLTEIATERQETENILQQWMEKERKLLEERLADHAADVRNMLEMRQAKKIAKVEEQRKILEERMEYYNGMFEKHLEQDKQEMLLVENDLDKCVVLEEESAKDMKKFAKEFDEGVGAINIDMEVFSKNVVEVVDHLNNQVLQLLEQIKTHLMQQVSNVISQDDSTYKQFVNDIDNAFTNNMDTTKHVMDEIIQNIQTTNNNAVMKLNDISTSTSQNITLTRDLLSEHSTQCGDAHSLVNTIHDDMTDAVEKQAMLEAKYLSQEYKLYTPTGKTPSRMEYRYPRNLVATSPHDRILARFRAMRQNSDDECIIVESDSDMLAASDSELQVSDSERSVTDSERSQPGNSSSLGDNFATPTLPVDNNMKFLKSTSDADILYTMKKQTEQGKENTERSASFKKPSKLPGPSSHKKPLMERNIN